MERGALGQRAGPFRTYWQDQRPRSVQRILKLASIKPHRIAYWKRKSDPAFDTKMRPIVRL